jgi:cobalt-zinc-cadmium resistance protein CzcA
LQEVLGRVRAAIAELNDGTGRFLPGVRIEPYWERAAPKTEAAAVWVRAAFPIDVSPTVLADRAKAMRAKLLAFSEVREVVSQVGQELGGTVPLGLGHLEAAVLLRPAAGWKAPPGRDRPLSRSELLEELRAELQCLFPGVPCDVTAERRDDFQVAFDAGPGEGLLKIIGPDLDVLEQRAQQAQEKLARLEHVAGVEIVRIQGPGHLEFRIDPDKCARWGVAAADVNNLIQSAVGGKGLTSMIEGEQIFDVALRWPPRMRDSEASILDIPVDISNNQVVPVSGPSPTPSPKGSGLAGPVPLGGNSNTTNPLSSTPRLRLRDLVSPLGPDGQPDRKGDFLHRGPFAIYRENGRLIAVRFRVQGEAPAAVVAEASKKLAPLFKDQYRAEWVAGR